MDIVKSARRYERWLRHQLDGDLVKEDLAAKHDKMAADAFQFLRATYWRWAETIYDACPDLKHGPHVLSVGDIHVENFGTWRDAEGRLVWGVNDFDEAARMPYALDIVRLAASAELAKVPGITKEDICSAILDGYRAGLVSPRPFVLDRAHRWLRDIVVVSTDARKDFWKKFDPQRIAEKKPKKVTPVPADEMPRRFRKAIDRAQPDDDVRLLYFTRVAGTGSLGRPRFFGVGPWRGDLIVREAKAMVRSGWALAHHGSHNARCAEIANGRHRSPDPTYCLRGHVLVRRLSPNDFKIEVKPKAGEEEKYNALPPKQLVNARMLGAMGHDLAAIHRGTRDADDIAADLTARADGWLEEAVSAAAAAVTAEWREWRRHHKGK